MEDWTEKYRPKTLDDIVGNKKAINDLKIWAKDWENNIPKKKAVILSGNPGIGKTTAAHALANDFNWASIELNTSDSRNAAKIKKVATNGSINETFDDAGSYVSSKKGGRKLIILDEADNLYEKSSKTDNNIDDLSDKGGKRAIVETVKITCQPIILIVNDYYNLVKGSGEALKNYTKTIRFYDPYTASIYSLLKKISSKEGINIDTRVIQTIADRSKGDIRSAVNDLQAICFDKENIDIKSLDVLGYRDRKKIIFDSLREIFKTKNIQSLRDSSMRLDEDPNNVILWINENIPKEYRDYTDLLKGYQAISKADVFLGRVYRHQDYGLWSYACDFMHGGVAVAKSRTYPNDRYDFPMWIKQQSKTKSNRDIRDTISKKIAKKCHNSNLKSKNFLLNYFIQMFKNNIDFAIKMKDKLELSEIEIKYLIGDDKNIVKQILKPVKKEEKTKETKEEKKKDKEEKMQQSLLDF